MKSAKMCEKCGRQNCACGENCKCSKMAKGGTVKKYACGGQHKERKNGKV